MKFESCFVFLATTCFVAVHNELSAQESKPTPVKAIAPFDAAQAKALQIAWADYLGVPVAFTNSINMKFAVIPAGEFMMGSPESEPGRLDEEKQRSVRLINSSDRFRSATRSVYKTSLRIHYLGFRVVLDSLPGPLLDVDNVSRPNSK